PLSWDRFISLLREAAEAPVIQVAGKIPEKIGRVAVCGGAGRSLIPAALACSSPGLRNRGDRTPSFRGLFRGGSGPGQHWALRV
ncbi:MAG: hypothetical protein EHM75_12895, partial [Desulfobacteraceae bacterium]